MTNEQAVLQVPRVPLDEMDDEQQNREVFDRLGVKGRPADYGLWANAGPLLETLSEHWSVALERLGSKAVPRWAVVRHLMDGGYVENYTVGQGPTAAKAVRKAYLYWQRSIKG